MRPLHLRPGFRAHAVGLVWAACAALSAGTAQAQAGGPFYPVSGFEIEYALPHEGQIPLDDLYELEVGLRPLEDGYTAPRPVDRTVRFRLATTPRNARLSATAIQHINQHIVSTFRRRGVQGVLVTVPEIEEGTGRDLRPAGRTALRLRIWTGRVTRLSSYADGDRYGGLTTSERTDNATHAWIRQRSPVQPGGERGLLDVAALRDYAARVSRHPGRRVDAELAAGPLPGTTDVNLRVAETKPWFAYAQYSNTGTEATTRSRQRFGLTHNQLFGRDDILRVDYMTGNFDDVHAVVGSYEAPFTLAAPEWRGRVRGAWSRFDASQVGFSQSVFNGDQVLIDGAVSYNALQLREFFLDVDAGLRWQSVTVDNKLFDQTGRDHFVLPEVGATGERNTAASSLRIDSRIAWNLPGVAGTQKRQIVKLGNPDPTKRFSVFRWDASYSFYLEPLIDPAGWRDPSTPGSSTLAHEFALALRGQYAFGKRLVPQYQQIAGGLYSVRGYRQSEVAGDSVFLGSFEYRFHVPRLLHPNPEPPQVPVLGRFRVRPQHVYGRPDWDLILRAFVDGARVIVSDRKRIEANETLASVGLGAELLFMRNLRARVDVGHVLSTVELGDSNTGNTRVNVVATVLY